MTLPADAPSHRSLPTLDGYRAIAALAVVTTHVAFSTGLVLQPIVGPITSRLDFGVCLFFLLSGFLLYRPWARHSLGLGTSPVIRVYALRRTLRIMPAYLVMAVVTLALLPEIQPVARSTWLHYLTLTHIYVDIPPVEGLTQVWSLATEVSFYVALPFLAWVLGRRWKSRPRTSFHWQVALLVLVVLSSVVVNALRGWSVGIDPVRWSYLLPTYLDWFAIGMFLALVREIRQVPRPPRLATLIDAMADEVPTCLIIAACVFAIVCTPIGGSLVPFGNSPIYATVGPWAALSKHLLYGICAAFLLLPGFLGSRDRGIWRQTLSSPIPTYLGTISYGIFLWHLVLLRVIIALTHEPLFSGGFWWLWPATVAASVAAASISWWVVERPLQSLSHRYRPRAERPSTPSGPGREPARV